MKTEYSHNSMTLAQNSNTPPDAVPVATGAKTALGLGLSGLWLVFVIAILGLIAFIPGLLKRRRSRHQPTKDQFV